MASKYNDSAAMMQVIGCIYKDPNYYLDYNDKYVITEEDFADDFHRIVYGVIYKLHELGASKITPEAINDFLETRPKSKGIFNLNKGMEYLSKVKDIAQPLTFDYYYSRLKKMSLLRAYDNIGLDVSEYYDPDNILDLKKKQLQEEWFDNTSIEQMADIVNKEIEEIYQTHVKNDVYGTASKAGEGLEELIVQFEKSPDVGVPLYGNYINTITRGARLGKFYLRSAPTGVGKTRSMIADACNIACASIYDTQYERWINNGKTFPTLFITTEQSKDEVQTMMLAFLSAVNEEHITAGKYEAGERDRVMKAAQLIKEAPLYIEELPEFNLQDVENTIKRNIRENHILYFFHDYIHTSIKILEEISQRAGKIALREDNILFMLSTRLKDICVKYGVFIMSATQLNGQYNDSETPDQNLLRGAKAIADKIDYGSILLPVKDDDLVALEPVIAKNPGWMGPTIKLSVYKNRRGRYKGVYLWCKADLGTCRIEPIFLTNYQYELQNIEDIKGTFKEEESVF